jgi:cytoskeletal protein CcmA (bactofilin family)
MSMSYRPSAQADDQPGRTSIQTNEPLSLIDRYSAIEGTFTTSRDVRVEGVVRGKIECQGLLYVAEGADIDANVEAANITVAGKLNGQVVCRGRMQIAPSGRVSATVTTDTLVIDEGAFYEGELTMNAGRGTPGTMRAESAGGPSIVRRFSTEAEPNEQPPVPRRSTGTTRP